MIASLRIGLPALFALAACGEAPTPQPTANEAKAQQAAPEYEEIAAPALPTDAQIADAIDGEIQRTVYSPPPGVIVEPDGLRTVVRNARCTPLSQGGSRTRCSYETTRSPMRFEKHEEAVDWVRTSREWRAETRSLVFARRTVAGHMSESWRIP